MSTAPPAARADDLGSTQPPNTAQWKLLSEPIEEQVSGNMPIAAEVRAMASNCEITLRRAKRMMETAILQHLERDGWVQQQHWQPLKTRILRLLKRVSYTAKGVMDCSHFITVACSFAVQLAAGNATEEVAVAIVRAQERVALVVATPADKQLGTDPALLGAVRGRLQGLKQCSLDEQAPALLALCVALGEYVDGVLSSLEGAHGKALVLLKEAARRMTKLVVEVARQKRRCVEERAARQGIPFPVVDIDDPAFQQEYKRFQVELSGFLRCGSGERHIVETAVAGVDDVVQRTAQPRWRQVALPAPSVRRLRRTLRSVMNRYVFVEWFAGLFGADWYKLGDAVFDGLDNVNPSQPVFYALALDRTVELLFGLPRWSVRVAYNAVLSWAQEYPLGAPVTSSKDDAPDRSQWNRGTLRVLWYLLHALVGAREARPAGTAKGLLGLWVATQVAQKASLQPVAKAELFRRARVLEAAGCGVPCGGSNLFFGKADDPHSASAVDPLVTAVAMAADPAQEGALPPPTDKLAGANRVVWVWKELRDLLAANPSVAGDGVGRRGGTP